MNPRVPKSDYVAARSLRSLRSNYPNPMLYKVSMHYLFHFFFLLRLVLVKIGLGFSIYFDLHVQQENEEHDGIH